MSTAKLGGMLLSSTDPARLADWYGVVFDAKVINEGGYRMVDLGGFWIMFDSRDDVGPANPEPGRMIFNVQVEDATAAAGRVDDNGGGWHAPLEDRDGSLFGTAKDLDGNYVQLIQFSPDHPMREQ